MEFIDLKTQYRRIEEKVRDRINTVLEHGRFIMGPEIKELETRLAEYVDAKHAIAVSSGTDALSLAMMALGIGHGDEVITTPFTFIATAETIALVGAKPVFVDIDPVSYNIDPEQIEQAITEKTKAIMPVDLYGLCANYDRINAIGKKHSLPVIEDGAQAFGATYKGKRACSLSTIGTTSFFPAKPLGCYGDGGACFTNDDELATRMKQLRVHGEDRRYNHPLIGLNARMDSLQAAITIEKLEIFPDEVRARERIGTLYTEALKDVVKTPVIEDGHTHVYAQYTIEVDDREKVMEHVNGADIPLAVHYPTPLHLQPAFEYLGYKEGSFPVSEKAACRVLSLPMSPYLSAMDQERVINAILSAVKK